MLFFQWISRSTLLKGSMVFFIGALLNACENDYTVTVHQPDKVWPGYVMPSPTATTDTAVIDLAGNIVKSYGCTGFPAKILPDGSIICNDLTFNAMSVPALLQVSWDGVELWNYAGFDGEEDARQHHDFQVGGTNPVGYYVPGMDMVGPAQGGNVLIASFQDYAFYEQDIRLAALQDSVLYEIDPQGNVVWQWHAKDHIDEMGFSDAALWDIFFGGFLVEDWLHLNSVSYVGPNKWFDEYNDMRFHPQNIIVSSPRGHWIGIIEKASGNIVWRMGPDFSEGNPGAEYDGFAFQHHAHVIPQGLPGAGNILLFDNGFMAGYGDQDTSGRWYSRVLEIDPQDYSLVWEYSDDLYSPIMSSAQRLPNGNTFISEGVTGKMVEVTQAKELVWEAKGPMIYRAYRVPAAWLLLD